jgi:hypothetical protein
MRVKIYGNTLWLYGRLLYGISDNTISFPDKISLSYFAIPWSLQKGVDGESGIIQIKGTSMKIFGCDREKGLCSRSIMGSKLRRL